MINGESRVQWRRLALFILAWAALTLLFSPEAYLYFYFRKQPIPWSQTLQLTVVNSAIALLFLPAIVWLTRRFPIERKTWPRALLVHVPACLLFSVGHSFLYWTACYASNRLGATLFFRFHPNLLTYWAIVGFTQALDYFERYTSREKELANAQLFLLRSQLHPHFLFNTLHTISAMMHEDVRAADRMLSRLSDLLRLTLESIGAHEIPLRQELEFVEKYLEIERIRFQERLILEVTVAPEARDALVPSMILQPLVENSVRHGFGASRDKRAIHIAAVCEGSRLVLKISDNGKGFPGDVLAGSRQGLGLWNTRRRLEHLYPSQHQLRLTATPGGGAEVQIEVPFHTAGLIQSAREEELILHEDTSADRGRRVVGAKTDRYAPQS